MKRTADELASLVIYDKLAAIRLLEPPRLTKEDIPNLITCNNYKKAVQKIDQAMERYNRKVDGLKADIDSEEQLIDRANSETRYCNTSDPQSVARHNDWVDRGRRAVEKRNDFVDRHNEALAEARERLEELTRDALVVIDDDIVAVLDKCSRIVEKLSGSQNSEDFMVAIEISLMELRLFHFLEEHIEGNAARKDARDRIVEVNRVFGGLCTSEDVRNYLADVFRRNGYLVEKNMQICGEIDKLLGSVDQRELDRLTQGISSILAEKVETTFAYDGVVDPTKLDAIIVSIRGTIDALNRSIAKARELASTTKSATEAAVSAHQSAETLLSSMKANTEGMGKDILSRGHFACEMLEEAVIDDFYHKDLRPTVAALRQHVATTLGEEQLDRLVMPVEDRYLIGKAEAEIKQARLLRLKEERDKIDGHVKKLTNLIAGCEADIAKAGETPKRNADAFRSDVSPKYVLSCLPAIGILFAFGIMGKVKAFQTGFQSKNEIYRALAAETAARNKSMMTVVMVLTGLAAAGSIVGFFMLRDNQSLAMTVGVAGGVVALLYLSTMGIFSGLGKQLGA